VPGALQTNPGGINNKGVMVGYYQDKRGFWHGYILKGGLLTRLDDPKGTNTYAVGINLNGPIMVVGSYINSSGTYVGFKYNAVTKKFTDIPGPQGALSSLPQDINDQGWIVGQYVDSSNKQHGFLLQGKKYRILDVPGATVTSANGINNKREIVLAWSDGSYPWKGSGYNIEHKTHKPINGVPGAGPWGSVPVCINDEGDIAFYWWNSSNLPRGALLDDHTYYTFDYPKAYQTAASCLNDRNAMVGEYYKTESSGWSGFIATFK
jgi:uncharacterized membrane protein